MPSPASLRVNPQHSQQQGVDLSQSMWLANIEISTYNHNLPRIWANSPQFTFRAYESEDKRVANACSKDLNAETIRIQRSHPSSASLASQWNEQDSNPLSEPHALADSSVQNPGRVDVKSQLDIAMQSNFNNWVNKSLFVQKCLSFRFTKTKKFQKKNNNKKKIQKNFSFFIGRFFLFVNFLFVNFLFLFFFYYFFFKAKKKIPP